MADRALHIPVPLQPAGERRRAERFAAAMPLSVDGRQGTTQDLSTSGLSFHSERAYAPGTMVEVVIEYLLDGHRYPLRCRAEVVRCAAQGGAYTVGARLAPQSEIASVPVGDDAPPAPGRPALRSV